MSRIRILADERGLVGKILVLWLVLGIVFLVLAYDVVQVGIARYRVAETAQSAAYEAASTLRSTRGDRTAAYRAASAVVEEDGVRLVEFVIGSQDAVTVTVSDKASTLLVGRIGFLKGFAKARASETSATAP